MQRTPEDLRQRATEIRHCAQHAERLSDARVELQQADRLEAEADRLEGKVRTVPPAPPIPQQTAEEREQLSRARIADAIAKMKKRFDMKK